MSEIRKSVLSNGIKIITETLPESKSFSLGFWFEVGSRFENSKNNGITHFIEHMFFKGTKNRSAKRIVTEIESSGGYLNAFTSKEHTCYYSRGLAEHFNTSFEVLSDMILNSLFRQSDIEKEAGVIIDELRDLEDNPEELIFDRFEELVFDGTSLGYSVIGMENNIRKFKHSDFINYIYQRYAYDKMLIVTSGAVKHDEVLKYAEKYFNKSLKKSYHTHKYFNNHFPKPTTKNINKEIQQVHTILGTRSYGFKSKKRIHIALLSQILGEGSSSRLFQSLRERNGITYQIHSFLNSYLDVSVFGIYFSTNERMINKALKLVEHELLKIRSIKVSDKELDKAKESLKGQIILSMENTSNRMIRIAQSELYFNKVKTIDDIIKEIDLVTSSDVSNAANEFLDPKMLFRLYIKPATLKLN